MKQLLFIFFFGLLISSCQQNSRDMFTVKSPDDCVLVQVFLTSMGQPAYTITYENSLVIDTEGNVEISGDLYVAGTVESSGITLQESDLSHTESGFSKLLIVKAEGGEEVASVDASGSAKFSSVATDSLEITSDEGKVLGNANIRDAVAILPGQTIIDVEKDWPTIPASIVLSPTYNTQAWVTNITENGFTINVNTMPENEEIIKYINRTENEIRKLEELSYENN